MKLFTYFILISLTLITLITSCEQDPPPNDTTIIIGYLLEYGPEEVPLKEKAIYLQECDGNHDSFGCWTVDTFYTNTDGYFYHEFQHKLGSYQIVPASISGYYDIEDYVINVGKSNQMTLIADPYAWLKIHVKNTNPVNDSDRINFVGGWAGGSSDIYYGTNVDFVDIKRVRGNRQHYIKWWVTKNNNMQVFEDNLTYGAHDTIEYEILY